MVTHPVINFYFIKNPNFFYQICPKPSEKEFKDFEKKHHGSIFTKLCLPIKKMPVHYVWQKNHRTILPKINTPNLQLELVPF